MAFNTSKFLVRFQRGKEECYFQKLKNLKFDPFTHSAWVYCIAKVREMMWLL